jgi:hypothetical protein
MAITSLWLGNLRYRSMAAEPKLEIDLEMESTCLRVQGIHFP